MHLLVLAIFGKYCIRHILCRHSKIVTIFQQHCLNISVLEISQENFVWVSCIGNECKGFYEDFHTGIYLP